MGVIDQDEYNNECEKADNDKNSIIIPSSFHFILCGGVPDIPRETIYLGKPEIKPNYNDNNKIIIKEFKPKDLKPKNKDENEFESIW